MNYIENFILQCHHETLSNYVIDIEKAQNDHFFDDFESNLIEFEQSENSFMMCHYLIVYLQENKTNLLALFLIHYFKCKFNKSIESYKVFEEHFKNNSITVLIFKICKIYNFNEFGMERFEQILNLYNELKILSKFIYYLI